MIPIKLNTLPGLESLPDAVTVRGNPHPVPFSPPIDPDHVFSVDVVRPILGWMLYDSPDMLLLFGDRGSGSSHRGPIRGGGGKAVDRTDHQCADAQEAADAQSFSRSGCSG